MSAYVLPVAHQARLCKGWDGLIAREPLAATICHAVYSTVRIIPGFVEDVRFQLPLSISLSILPFFVSLLSVTTARVVTGETLDRLHLHRVADSVEIFPSHGAVIQAPVYSQ